MSSFHTPNTLYRIQSLDFKTCLELWDEEDDPVVLRPLGENKLQQWLLVKIESDLGDRYKIMAAATRSSSNPGYLTTTTSGGETQLIVVPAEYNASIWHIYEHEKGFYMLAAQGENSHSEVFLKLNSTGEIDLTEKRISARHVVDRSMRWDIVEYFPSLPKGIYRIRTLNGTVLDIDTGLAQLSVQTVRSDRYRQEWNIDPKGNGNCVISLNTVDPVYLGWEKGESGTANVISSKTPVEWFIQKLSDFTYSISCDYIVDEKTTLTLALSIADHEILLRPKKVVHSQIWFFENIDELLPYETPSTPNTLLVITNERYPEISDGAVFRVRSVGKNVYFGIYGGTSIWTVELFGTTNATYFYSPKITYVGNTNTFRMSYTSQYTRYTKDFVEATNNHSEIVTDWVFERFDDPAGGYLYYICPALDRSLAISGETVVGPNSRNHPKVVSKKYGNILQQWKLEPNL